MLPQNLIHKLENKGKSTHSHSQKTRGLEASGTGGDRDDSARGGLNGRASGALAPGGAGGSDDTGGSAGNASVGDVGQRNLDGRSEDLDNGGSSLSGSSTAARDRLRLVLSRNGLNGESLGESLGLADGAVITLLVADLGSGPSVGSGGLGADMDGLSSDLGGQLTLVARAFTRARGNGVGLGCGESLGDAASGLRRSFSDKTSRLAAARAPGGVRSDDLGGDMSVWALSHGWRARSDGVHGSGGESRGVSGSGLGSSLSDGGSAVALALSRSGGRAVGVVS